MAAEVNIEDYYVGETLGIRLFAKARGGVDVIETPASQIIHLTIGRSPGKSPTDLTFSDKYTLLDSVTGEFLIEVLAADLVGIREGKTYYYNLWSQITGLDPILQAKGQLITNPSLGLT